MVIGILFMLLLCSIFVPVLYYNRGEKTAKRGKIALVANLLSFAVVVVAASVFIFSGTAYAAAEDASDMARAAAYIGAALVTGLGCLGTGIAVGPAATAAIGAISENEKIMGKAIIYVSMAEGIAIYGLLISFMILSRV